MYVPKMRLRYGDDPIEERQGNNTISQTTNCIPLPVKVLCTRAYVCKCVFMRVLTSLKSVTICFQIRLKKKKKKIGDGSEV